MGYRRFRLLLHTRSSSPVCCRSNWSTKLSVNLQVRAGSDLISGYCLPYLYHYLYSDEIRSRGRCTSGNDNKPGRIVVLWILWLQFAYFIYLRYSPPLGGTKSVVGCEADPVKGQARRGRDHGGHGDLITLTYFTYFSFLTGVVAGAVPQVLF